MLDRKLSGCLVMMWAKPMDPDVTGTLNLFGKAVHEFRTTAVDPGKWQS